MGGRAWERTPTTTTRRSPADRRSRGRTRGSRRKRVGSNGPKRGGETRPRGPAFSSRGFSGAGERPSGVFGVERRGAAGADGRLPRVGGGRGSRGRRGARARAGRGG